ncbi:LysE family translocator [Stappia sp. 28M-7]|uniref:LysE family translocator n=1 Tax=Stappia sp. 28M-7 TaxID=2762596 RepID=UPI00163C1F11|nr:LysE family transporter [Stappia sp. 28M-7]MBC2858238.1 LysE family transporter [Stappia sp. 28M-7]
MEWLGVFVAVFAIFLPALMLPGPDFIAVVRSSMAHGARAGLLTTAGVSLGLGVYATLSLVGLSALLVQYQWLAVVLRVAGGLYLAWLGLRLLFARPQELELDAAARTPRRNPLVFGFLVTMTNPKAIVLFASVFATSVSATTPAWVLVAMVALVVVSAALWYTLVSLFMSSAPVLRRFSGLQHWIERVAGACFVAIGGRILADARNPLSP